jgi:hypothetical protein
MYMDKSDENWSDFSETEENTSTVRCGPFRDDPVWDNTLATACDIQGSIGRFNFIILKYVSYFSGPFIENLPAS